MASYRLHRLFNANLSKEMEKMFCVLFDMGMSAIMFIIGILFYKSNGKATNFLSGYNMRSTEERKNTMRFRCAKTMEKE